MTDRQKRRAEYRTWKKGYYHLCTDGLPSQLLFYTQAHYVLGMAAIALITLLFPIKIYAFELMPNHLHIVLSGDGETCEKVFTFLTRRISRILARDGYPKLPKNYDYRLIPIEDRESLKNHIIYLDRNPYEKGISLPTAYRWGSGWLLYNDFLGVIGGKRVKDLTKRELNALTGTRHPLPPDWIVHPSLGILPTNYIQIDKLKELFPSAKDYMTALVKDYEAYARVAESLKEEIQWSDEEVKDLADSTLRNTYPDQPMKAVGQEQKCKVAVLLAGRYGLSSRQLAKALWVPEKVIAQSLRSKDYASLLR